MNVQEKENRKIIILSYIFYYISLSYWINSSFNIVLLRTLQMGVIVAIMLVEKKYVIKKNALFISVTLLLLEFLQLYLNRTIFFGFCSTVGCYYCTFFVSIVDFKIFKGSYVDFMTFISGYSLIMWEAYKIVPHFFIRFQR